MTEEQLQRFIKEYPKKRKSTLLSEYQMSQAEYEKIRDKYNLKKAQKGTLTYEETQYIKNHCDLSITALARHLNRSTVAVRDKLISLDLYEPPKSSLNRKRLVSVSDEAKYIMCLWWLSGDSIHEIAFIFACSDEDVKQALKNEDTMYKALYNRLRGIFALKRSKGEILKQIGRGKKKEKRVDRLINLERERGLMY